MSARTWDELFKGRTWRVLTEATGTVTTDPVAGTRVIFRRGHFEIEGPGVFQSPLSANKGKRGVLLQETRDGEDVAGSRIPVGEKILPRARVAHALI